VGSELDPPKGGGSADNGPKDNGPKDNGPKDNGPEKSGPENSGPNEAGSRSGEPGAEPSGPQQRGPRKSALGANRAGKGGTGGQPGDKPGDKPQPDKPTKLKPLGSIQFQDAGTTKPRPPTPAELRARKKYEDKQREIEQARLAAEAKRQKQKRVLMGSAAAVGVVGLVAGLGYWLLSPDNVTAQCVREDTNGQPVIVPDSYCTGRTPGMNGFFFWGGHQYRYYYGSSGSVGQRPIGGSTSVPRGATVKTKSGTTIQRGGIGGSGGKGGGSGGS
jgi:hypothetical protein